MEEQQRCAPEGIPQQQPSPPRVPTPLSASVDAVRQQFADIAAQQQQQQRHEWEAPPPESTSQQLMTTPAASVPGAATPHQLLATATTPGRAPPASPALLAMTQAANWRR